MQAQGTTPAAMAERMGTGFRTIYSREAAAALKMYHTDGASIQLPTGFRTTNPGAASRELWLDGGVLKIGS
jgi:hypothetical protein